LNISDINNCPGTLAPGFKTYSATCLKNLFMGKKVNHILPYSYTQNDEEDTEKFLESRSRISISGIREKVSMILIKNKLRLTEKGEQGTYILKPIPRDLKKYTQVPANEHLTMQIAKQVYGIKIAENALIFFKNGEPAYITKRFDIKPDGTKLGKEDFASLAGKTKDTAGPDFKYEYSYEEAGQLLKRYVPAYKVEIINYFKLIVFNYLFSNGDAHLKNFSLLETSSGDYILSPAYDLVNTRIHVDDSDFALKKGLFADDFKSEYYKKTNHPCKSDFVEFAKRIEIPEKDIEFLLKPFLMEQEKVEQLTNRSFLDDKCKKSYLLNYKSRRKWLNEQ